MLFRNSMSHLSLGATLQRVLEGQVVAERSRRNVVLHRGERARLVNVYGKDVAVKDAADQAELADVEHVGGGGEEGGGVVVHVGHPDADRDREAGVPGSKTFTDDTNCERGRTKDAFLVQRLRQDKTGRATTRLDWMRWKVSEIDRYDWMVGLGWGVEG